MSLIVMFLFTITCYAAGKNLPAQRPDIVIFLVEEMGWSDCSVDFWGGKDSKPLVKTPNIEKLAENGTKFTRAYASAFAFPSRVSLMTGLTPLDNKVSNLPVQKSPEGNSGEDELTVWNFDGLQPGPQRDNSGNVTTIPQILSGNGYLTVTAGPHGIASDGTPGPDPAMAGYQYNISSIDGIESFGILPDDGRPLFMMVNYCTEAQPVADNDPCYRKYLTEGYSEPRARHAAKIACADSVLGTVMDFLRNKRNPDNTIVIFASACGTHSPASKGYITVKNNYPLRGGQGLPYEGGIRVPLIVSSPKMDASSCRTPVHIADLFPTVMDMAGVKKFKTEQNVEGKSLVPLLKNDNFSSVNRTLVWHHPYSNGNGKDEAYSAILKNDWKLIYFYETGATEMYYLKDDIFEVINQGKSPMTGIIRDRLSRELTRYLKKTGSAMLYNRETKEWCRYPDGKPYKGDR